MTSAGDDAERSDEEERRLTSAEPALFREAVAAMNAVTVRPEIELGPIRPPQRLAPYSYALGAEIKHPELDVIPERSEGDAFGRLIMLYDPDGSDAWDGTIRLVAYVQADLDSSEAVDPLLPEVAWSWLVDALTARTDQVRALGGTVTATTSVRYGDISGPPRAHQLELRASWTATTPDLGAISSVLRRPGARGRPAASRGHRPGLAVTRLTCAPSRLTRELLSPKARNRNPPPCSGPPVGYRICV